MAFVPPSSLPSGTVTVVGTVTTHVDNFPAVQAISAEALPLPDGAATDATLGDLLAAERGASDALGLVANALTDVDPTSLGDE